MRIYLVTLFLTAFCIFPTTAQNQLLTKEKAIKLTLENNLGIVIAENNVRVAENNKRCRSP